MFIFFKIFNFEKTKKKQKGKVKKEKTITEEKNQKPAGRSLVGPPISLRWPEILYASSCNGCFGRQIGFAAHSSVKIN
jgi:hypothetical protein